MARIDAETLRSRKAQLIADLAVARSGLRRDIGEVRQLVSVPGQIRSALMGNSGKVAATAGAVSVAIGTLVSRFTGRRGSGSQRRRDDAGSILSDGIAAMVSLLLSKGVDRYLQKDWQRAAARTVIALLGRK